MHRKPSRSFSLRARDRERARGRAARWHSRTRPDRHGDAASLSPCAPGSAPPARPRTTRSGMARDRRGAAMSAQPTFSTVFATGHVGNRLTGARCRCGGCGERFNSVSGFDRHRVGPPDARRCLTPAELVAKGWLVNSAGFWVTSAKAASCLHVTRRSGDQHDPAPRVGGRP